ncbi:MAG: DUF1573 domain-containing protein [Bacteroidales bacterium]|nr:DUF1573 domain-containing protein [Bacteroidales bacterium]
MKKNFYHIIFSTLLILVFSACGSQDNDRLSADIVFNPNTAGNRDASKKLPVITFLEMEHDFGKIIQGETVTYTFKFKNTGKSDLLVSTVSTSCGCTATKYSKEPVAPESDGFVQVTFISEGRKGFQNKTVTVLANTQPNKTILRIKALVVIPEKY